MTDDTARRYLHAAGNQNQMPNPITDELTDEQKAELAEKFAALKDRCEKVWAPPPEVVKPWAKSRMGW